jgi:hypothetical protein
VAAESKLFQPEHIDGFDPSGHPVLRECRLAEGVEDAASDIGVDDRLEPHKRPSLAIRVPTTSSMAWNGGVSGGTVISRHGYEPRLARGRSYHGDSTHRHRYPFPRGERVAGELAVRSQTDDVERQSGLLEVER